MKKIVNPFEARLAEFRSRLAKRKLDAAVVFGQSNVRALTGVDCDNACLLVAAEGNRKAKTVFFTDFRYVPAVERTAPYLAIGDIKKLGGKKPLKVAGYAFSKVGFESSITHAKFLSLKKVFPKAKLVDVLQDILDVRAVKTPDELDKLRAAEKLNDEIWADAQKAFKPGMTEKAMARVIQHLMIERGEGEAFATIVCVGANAAECHHVPDDTVWNGKEPVLVDMGVKLNGYCSDMTRNIVPERPSKLYKKVYGLVKKANELGIASVKPGITAGELDRIVRRFLEKEGFGKEFGHSLGHGVGIDIHEAPWAGKKQKMVLKAGMSVTIEPGIYLPGNLGVRIEDLVLVTENGGETISHSAK